MLYIDPYREKPLNIFLSETRRPVPLIFGTQLCLVNLCQDCSSYSPGAKMATPKTRRPSPLIFGTQLCQVDLYQDCSNNSPGVQKLSWP